MWNFQVFVITVTIISSLISKCEIYAQAVKFSYNSDYENNNNNNEGKGYVNVVDKLNYFPRDSRHEAPSDAIRIVDPPKHFGKHSQRLVPMDQNVFQVDPSLVNKTPQHFLKETVIRGTPKRNPLSEIRENVNVYHHQQYPAQQHSHKTHGDMYVVGTKYAVDDGERILRPNQKPHENLPYQLPGFVSRQGTVDQLRKRPYPRGSPHHYLRKRNGQVNSQMHFFRKNRTKRNADSPQIENRIDDRSATSGQPNQEALALTTNELFNHIRSLINDSQKLIESKDIIPHGESKQFTKGVSKEYQRQAQKPPTTGEEQSDASEEQPPKASFKFFSQQKSPEAEKLQNYRIPNVYRLNGQTNGKQNEKVQVDYTKSVANLVNIRHQNRNASIARPNNDKHSSLQVYNDVMLNIKSNGQHYNNNRYEATQLNNDNVATTDFIEKPLLPIFDITKYFSQIYTIKPDGNIFDIDVKLGSPSFKSKEYLQRPPTKDQRVQPQNYNNGRHTNTAQAGKSTQHNQPPRRYPENPNFTEIQPPPLPQPPGKKFNQKQYYIVVEPAAPKHHRAF